MAPYRVVLKDRDWSLGKTRCRSPPGFSHRLSRAASRQNGDHRRTLTAPCTKPESRLKNRPWSVLCFTVGVLYSSSTWDTTFTGLRSFLANLGGRALAPFPGGDGSLNTPSKRSHDGAGSWESSSAGGIGRELIAARPSAPVPGIERRHWLTLLVFLSVAMVICDTGVTIDPGEMSDLTGVGWSPATRVFTGGLWSRLTRVSAVLLPLRVDSLYVAPAWPLDTFLTGALDASKPTVALCTARLFMPVSLQSSEIDTVFEVFPHPRVLRTMATMTENSWGLRRRCQSSKSVGRWMNGSSSPGETASWESEVVVMGVRFPLRWFGGIVDRVNGNLKYLRSPKIFNG